MKKYKPKIFIVIPNLNGDRFLKDCLNSILNQKDYRIKTVLVDNGSSDKSVTTTKSLFPEVNIIKNNQNRGYAGGANRGVRFSIAHKADYIMILNNDTVLPQNFFHYLIETLENDRTIGIIGPKILFFDDPKKVWFSGGEIDQKRFTAGHQKKKSDNEMIFSTTEFITGCSMMVSKEVFQKIGFFDERFFIYYEDVDFCFRAKKAKYKIVYEPRATMFHKVPLEGRKSNFMDYLMARNHFLFMEKHGSLKVRMREYLRLPWTTIEHIKNREIIKIIGIKDYFIRKFGYEGNRS